MQDDGLVRLAVPVSEDDHARGPVDAPVTIVGYGDYECPFCRQVYPVMRALEKTYPGRLRFVFRSFPLTQHRHAQQAAEAAEFAADQGRFWEMHERLYAHAGALGVAELVEQARAIGLDGDALAVALRDGTYAGIIREVKEGGEESGIPGTPAFFLNGVLFEDEPTEEAFSNAIAWLLEHGSA